MALNIGDILTRDGLVEAVGAGGDSCILHRDGEVVALAMDPQKNPQPLQFLLVGKGPQKEKYARKLLESGQPVPLFVKQGPHQWKYMGNFAAYSFDQSPNTIALHSRKSNRADIWGVISLEVSL